MTTEDSSPKAGASRHIGLATGVYVGVVAAVGASLTAAAIRVHGLELDATFWAMVLLAVLAWWFGVVEVEAGRIDLSFISIVLLAAMALLGPAGAGIVGAVMGRIQQARAPLQAQAFNTGMLATMGVVGGFAYIAADGAPGGAEAASTWGIVGRVGVPVLVADVVQLFVNLVLLAGVVRLAEGMPMRTQALRLLRTSGPAHLGYGIIAFIMVVLWVPAGLGPASVVLVLPPLVVAQWAYRQYSEEVKGHELTLHVLVAAVEAKAPHLVGHSARVAELTAHMAEQLGLRGKVVADTRVAAMLHDLGQTTLPTPLVRGVGLGVGGPIDTYPARGVEVLHGISFLSGSLDAIARHRTVLHHRASSDAIDPALVVGTADEFDLLTKVGTPGGEVLGVAEALGRIREAPGAREDVVQALEAALARRGTVKPA